MTIPYAYYKKYVSIVVYGIMTSNFTSSRALPIPGTDRTISFDSMKRTGIAVTKIGASKAISIGAYNFALSQIDAK